MTIASSKVTSFQVAARSASLSPLDVWTAIKIVLRRELGEREWEMWIQHARLWRVLGEGGADQTLGVLVPRNGRACFGIQRHLKRVRALAKRMGFGVMVTVEYDLHYQQAKREAILAQDRGPDFPECHQQAMNLLEKWEEENSYITQPFLEPPCSPLWEGR